MKLKMAIYHFGNFELNEQNTVETGYNDIEGI